MKNNTFGSLYAIDSLGRRLCSEDQVGPARKDRYVGMFYFLTHGAGFDEASGEEGAKKIHPVNITEMLKEHPEAKMDYDHPGWKGSPLCWGEPLYGYYHQKDEWVLRKHIEMLTAAGVDFLVFDTTNRVTFFPHVRALLEQLERYRLEGWNVPKIVYYTNTKSGETIEEIYQDLYKPGLFPELWFYWEGKPLIIGEPSQCSQEVQDFFTFRLRQWPTEEKRELGFPWIDFERPQRVWNGPDGEPEVMSVSIAQHPNISFGDGAMYGDPAVRGRSYHDASNDHTPEAILYGYNVSEQWDRAIAVDPKIVFFTGWNEWSVGRMKGPSHERPVLLIDQANDEYSRDIEPMRGGFFDNYYMQFCNDLRRFKGAPAKVQAGEKKTIDVTGSFDQWEDVTAVYYDMPFAAEPRSHAGNGAFYRNDSGNNDIDLVKVARDNDTVYFYAKTRNPMEMGVGRVNMFLYIGIVGREYAPHWHYFHYLVNQIVMDGNTTVLQTSKGGYRWGDNRRVSYRKEGNEIMVAIPRELLGLEKEAPFALHFKWVDHVGLDHTIEEFYENGDTAPFGRFSYLYEG